MKPGADDSNGAADDAAAAAARSTVCAATSLGTATSAVAGSEPMQAPPHPVDESLTELVASLRASRGFVHKQDIGDVLGALQQSLPGGPSAPRLAQAIAIGDDCAAIPFDDAEGPGHLLFAIEGFVDDFVQAMPWFAGYSGVMVNVSDIYAMGGRPIAVVDALWSRGDAAGDQLLAGLAAASQRYGVPIVGGHSNRRSERGGLAVAILGRARQLLTSFDARVGDRLVMAIDLRGAFEEPQPFWNASTCAPAARLRADLEVLPALAEAGLCVAAKDISMAGAIGTALMLLEGSKVGAVIDVEAIPRPPGVALARWLQAFPSYGFVLSVRPEQVAAVLARFDAREIACAVVGEVTPPGELWLRRAGARALLWDLAGETFIGARERPSGSMSPSAPGSISSPLGSTTEALGPTRPVLGATPSTLDSTPVPSGSPPTLLGAGR